MDFCLACVTSVDDFRFQRTVVSIPEHLDVLALGWAVWQRDQGLEWFLAADIAFRRKVGLFTSEMRPLNRRACGKIPSYCLCCLSLTYKDFPHAGLSDGRLSLPCSTYIHGWKIIKLFCLKFASSTWKLVLPLL